MPRKTTNFAEQQAIMRALTERCKIITFKPDLDALDNKIGDTCEYEKGWDDSRVAALLGRGLNQWHIERMRLAWFGQLVGHKALKGSAAVSALTTRVEGLEARLDHAHDSINLLRAAVNAFIKITKERNPNWVVPDALTNLLNTTALTPPKKNGH